MPRRQTGKLSDDKKGTGPVASQEANSC